MRKALFSVADDSAFIEKINDKSRSTILLSGIETHICVWQSARDLYNRGYRVVVVGDATTSRSSRDHSCALSCMQQIGIGVISVEMLLFDLQKTSEGENFKLISKLCAKQSNLSQGNFSLWHWIVSNLHILLIYPAWRTSFRRNYNNKDTARKEVLVWTH